MIEYSKIETLYDRDEKTFSVIPAKLRLCEFGLIKEWMITEKIDGTNIRVHYSPQSGVVFGGRTDNAQMPVFLMQHLQATFTPEKMQAAFPELDSDIILFGEGYGEKIQKGGGNYRKGASFRLFDALVGGEWWLERDSIQDIANKLSIPTAPELGNIFELPKSEDDLREIMSGGQSQTAKEDGGAGLEAEGIIARTSPILKTRRGHRLIWKLKFSDFRNGKR